METGGVSTDSLACPPASSRVRRPPRVRAFISLFFGNARAVPGDFLGNACAVPGDIAIANEPG